MFRSVSMATAPQPRLFLQESSKELRDCRPPTCAPNREPEDISASIAWVWKIENLQPIPMYHPLERTALIMDGLTVDIVTARISGFMKNHSITCSYQSNEGWVECLTDGLLKFVVQLWQGSKNSKHAIIMEVQRLQGCSMELQKLRSELAQAIHSEKSSDLESNPWKKATCDCLESVVRDNTAFLPLPENKNLATALELCQQMLESGRLDENRLGLESLCILTDPSKVMAKDADLAAHTILSNDSFQRLMVEYFLHMKVSNSDEPTFAHDDNDGDITMNYEQGSFFGSMHFLALKIVSQSLELVQQQPIKASIDLSASFWHTVLQALYYNLKVASNRPLEASISIRCLRLLQTVEPTMGLESAELANQRGLYECLLSARQYGRKHSRSLEQETEALMGRLGFAH